MPGKEIIAMLLAGGKGTRLGVMTDKLAKPAIPFGGEFRLIDFPLSNCANSGIDTVGVMTQYEPLVLNSYIGNGSSWDLDRQNGGVIVLPPYLDRKRGANWYSGTANAIYQNIDYIETYDPEFVLVLSGDHIYKMDYSLMLKYHKEKNADVSIAVMEVPWEDTNRFGIMNTDKDDRIKEFLEKPEDAESNLASMGIYIFSWKYLKEYLVEDTRNPDSSGDFGKNIIPMMLEDKLSIYAYRFNGYWKDVGTIESYWSAHMDLLEENSELDLYDRDWIISSVNPHLPPIYISPDGDVIHSLVNKGSQIYGKVEDSVIFFDTIIEKDAIVKESIILPNVTIGKGSYINKAVICQDVTIGPNCKISYGTDEHNKITVIGEGKEIPEGTTIDTGFELE